jgi:hypothetical protein
VLLPLPALRLREPLPEEERDAAEVVRRERDDALDELRRDPDLRPERPEDARWSLGISALTTAFTSRGSSASRNFAIRSSSRRIDLASCAVSLSPTSLAKVSIRV